MYKSTLFDEKTFFSGFLRDLEESDHEVIIESPFITTERMNTMRFSLVKLVERGIRVYVVTRDPSEHGNGYDEQSEAEIRYLEA